MADDESAVRGESPDILISQELEETPYPMGIRGLGVLAIRDLFDIAALWSGKRIEPGLRRERWTPEAACDCREVDDPTARLLGVHLFPPAHAGFRWTDHGHPGGGRDPQPPVAVQETARGAAVR